jgi:hypothetical protein
LERHVRQALPGRHAIEVVYAGCIELLIVFFESKQVFGAELKLNGSSLFLTASFSLIQKCDIHIVQLEPSVCRIKNLLRGEGEIEAFFMRVEWRL